MEVPDIQENQLLDMEVETQHLIVEREQLELIQLHDPFWLTKLTLRHRHNIIISWLMKWDGVRCNLGWS